jgi:hypothetical protein
MALARDEVFGVSSCPTATSTAETGVHTTAKVGSDDTVELSRSKADIPAVRGHILATSGHEQTRHVN